MGAEAIEVTFLAPDGEELDRWSTGHVPRADDSVTVEGCLWRVAHVAWERPPKAVWRARVHLERYRDD